MKSEISFTNGENKKYEKIKIHDNGWVECITEYEGEDYYSPHVVKCVTGNNVFLGEQ